MCIRDSACSKGTYVRVLLEDIGRALGVPATMSALQRLQAGEYRLEDSHTLEEIYEEMCIRDRSYGA